MEVLLMVRISKQPDERRNELMETADRLFSERGFAAVRVSDIVSAMGVAQGTFYYYFQSKDEILVSLLEQKWQQIAAFINEKISAVADPAARLSAALTFMIMPGDDIISDPDFRLLTDPSVTGLFHPDLDSARIKSLLPVMSGIIDYGIKRRAFMQFQNTDEVVKVVFLGISSFFHQIEAGATPSAVSAVCELIERVLGLSSGSLKINLMR
jgi:AcrR family transcriptional regulator